jgi:hypothetical protein
MKSVTENKNKNDYFHRASFKFDSKFSEIHSDSSEIQKTMSASWDIQFTFLIRKQNDAIAGLLYSFQ